MRIHLGASVLLICCWTLLTQAQTTASAAPPANPVAKSSDAAPVSATLAKVEDATLNFSSSLPSDWQGMPTVERKSNLPYPAETAPAKGDACVEVELTARHGDSRSVVVVLALPFACYGQTMTEEDLANLGEGAAEGLKQTFAISSQGQGNYSLGNHAVWIERADGTPNRQPEIPYTFEIVCTVLAKGAACWMTMAADAASLRDFEQQDVMLGGDTFEALVPAGHAPAVQAVAAKKVP